MCTCPRVVASVQQRVHEVLYNGRKTDTKRTQKWTIFVSKTDTKWTIFVAETTEFRCFRFVDMCHLGRGTQLGMMYRCYTWEEIR